MTRLKVVVKFFWGTGKEGTGVERSTAPKNMYFDPAFWKYEDA
jgi:hypothetical protein